MDIDICNGAPEHKASVADNQALQSFGRLAGSGEVACLAGALLVLPALLHVMSRIAGKTTK